LFLGLYWWCIVINYALYSGIFIVMVFVAACSQILLKQSAMVLRETKLAEYLNHKVILAYGMFGITVMVNMILLRFMPISLVPILETLGIVFVALLSWFIMKEKLNKKQMIGIAIIICGIIVFSI